MGREAAGGSEDVTRIVLSDTVDPELEGPRAPTYPPTCLPTCWLPIACAGEVSRDGCTAQSRCNGRARTAAGIAMYGALDTDVLERFIAYRVRPAVAVSRLLVVHSGRVSRPPILRSTSRSECRRVSVRPPTSIRRVHRVQTRMPALPNRSLMLCSRRSRVRRCGKRLRRPVTPH